MKKEQILDWHQFCYLNGIRKNNLEYLRVYQDYLFGLRDLGIIAPNGQIEKKMQKIAKEQQELSELLMAMVDQERKKDISLFLEDL